MRWFRWLGVIGLCQTLALSSPAQPVSPDRLDPYPLDEAVAAFRRVKPWIYFCQTQAIRTQSKNLAIGAAVLIPLAIIIFKSTRLGLMTWMAEWYVGEEIFAALLSSIWLLSGDANKQARDQEKQIRTNNLDWISRIYTLPDAEKEEISNQLIANTSSYLYMFYALTPQEATELLRSNAMLRALTLRLGEVNRILKKKKKLDLCVLDEWVHEQHFTQVPETP